MLRSGLAGNDYKERAHMQILKLFSSDTEQAYRLRQRPGSGYVEGRGSYPEGRGGKGDRSPRNSHDEDWGLEFPMPIQADQHESWESVRGVTRRRMPLTTLDALVQIKVNGLAHG